MSLDGVTQLQLAQSARYVVGVGLLIADDFLAHAVTKEQLSNINTKAAYIIRIKKPMPAWFFSFGIGIALIPEGGVGKIRCPAKSAAESWGNGHLMLELDMTNKFKLRTDYIIIDLKETEGRIVQIPTDEDIVKLHWLYQEACAANPGPKKKKKQQHGEELTITEKTKMKRGLRAIDRRRWAEAGLVPPPDRYADLKKIQAALNAKSEHDPTIDDDGDEDEYLEQLKASRETDETLFTAKLFRDLLGDDPSEAKAAASAVAAAVTPPPLPKTNTTNAVDAHDVVPQNPGSEVVKSALSQFSKPSVSKPKKTNLQAVLRSLQAQSRRQSQPQSGKRRETPYVNYKCDGGDDGGGGGDMEY